MALEATALAGGLALAGVVIAGVLFAPVQWPSGKIAVALLLPIAGLAISLTAWISRKESRLKEQLLQAHANASRLEADRAKLFTEAAHFEYEVYRYRAVIEGLEETVAELQARLKAESAMNVLEELRRYQDSLEHARDEFLDFLDGVSPLAERFGEFIASGEEGHERIRRLIDALDGAAVTLGVDDNGMILKVPVPDDPTELFTDLDTELSDSELHKAYRRVSAVIHPDKASRANVAWLKDIFETLTKAVNSRYDELKVSRKARS